MLKFFINAIKNTYYHNNKQVSVNYKDFASNVIVVLNNTTSVDRNSLDIVDYNYKKPNINTTMTV